MSIEQRPPFRVRGRSLMALVLTPAPTVRGWLETLDEQIARSPGFFDDRAVILDLTLLPADEPDLAGLAAALSSRGVSVVGTEGAHPAWTGLGIPSLPAATRPGRAFAVPDAPGAPPPDQPPSHAAQSPPAHSPLAGSGLSGSGLAGSALATSLVSHSLLLDRPVRSGQTVSFETGDVTVVGAVASGSEITAGGSIHVYGPLRGRAIAGVAGTGEARIFCARMEAELVAIGGIYLTADEVPKAFRGKPVQVRLEQQALVLAKLD